MNRRDVLKYAGMVLGGVSSSGMIHAVLADTDELTPIEKSIFNNSQRKQLATLAELIIPETDTSGATEAGVPHFIELMVLDWYTKTEREVFIAGLASIDDYCYQQASRVFNHCSRELQIEALQHQETISLAVTKDVIEVPFFGSLLSEEEKEKLPFFVKLKELTVLGYYTSKLGATQELSYNPMPMRYDGEFNFSEVGKQWSW